MPRSSHSSRFDHPNNIWWGVQIIKLLIMQSSPFLARTTVSIYELTEWRWALLEKLVIPQLIKTFTALCGSRNFVSTAPRHLSLSWARSIHYTLCHPVNVNCNIIRPSTPRSSKYMKPKPLDMPPFFQLLHRVAGLPYAYTKRNEEIHKINFPFKFMLPYMWQTGGGYTFNLLWYRFTTHFFKQNKQFLRVK